MRYVPKFKVFKFDEYSFDAQTLTTTFKYSFDDTMSFEETATFEGAGEYDAAVLDSLIFLSFVITGISYYKCFPTKEFDLNGYHITPEQAEFFSRLYTHGLSQFIYENNLSPEDIGIFHATTDKIPTPVAYKGEGVSVLQSGGKDSLLLAQLLQEKGIEFSAVYMQQSDYYPHVIDEIGVPVRRFRRTIDKTNLGVAAIDGALNGHVPVTYITLAYALIDAVLNNAAIVAAAIGREGEEPHAHIGDFAVTHQWSKTWEAEQMFAKYILTNVSDDIHVGSPLRGYSELKIVELFAHHCWPRFGRSFASCNVANYQQGHDNTKLVWCGNCPKCANSYLLFAPFVDRSELNEVFGKDLYLDEKLIHVFKGLLGVENYIKPFECVGEIAELRSAYWQSQSCGYEPLPFEVPMSDYDKDITSSTQDWALQMIQ